MPFRPCNKNARERFFFAVAVFRRNWLTLLWGLVPLGAQGQSELPLYPEAVFPELAPALEAAAEVHPSIQAANMRAALAAARADEAAAAKRPRATAFARTTGTYITREDIDAEWRAGLDGNLTLSQPIYHWGALDATIDAGRAASDATQAETLVERQRLLAHVRDLYLRWRQAEALDAQLVDSIAATEQRIDAQRQLLEAGQRSEADVLRVELSLLENEETRAANAIELNSVAREFFAATGNQPPSGVADAVFGLPTVEAIDRWAAALRQQIEGTDAFQAASARAREAAARLEIARVAQRPKVDLVTGVFGDQLDSVNNTDSVYRVQYFAGLQVRWDFFDGGRTRARIISEQATQRLREAESEALADRLATDLARRLAELELHRSRVETRDARIAILERQVELLERESQRDRTSQRELVEQRLRLAELRRLSLDARFAFLRTLNAINAVFFPDPILLR